MDFIRFTPCNYKRYSCLNKMEQTFFLFLAARHARKILTVEQIKIIYNNMKKIAFSERLIRLIIQYDTVF